SPTSATVSRAAIARSMPRTASTVRPSTLNCTRRPRHSRTCGAVVAIGGFSHNMPMEHPVVIAGAGPTGLVLALWLTPLGVGVRIFDPAPEPGTTSRALVVHARILEHYAQLGLADELVTHGIPLRGINLWVGGK